MSSSLIGRTLGQYKIVESLGQGGMATVYIGYQESIDRRVAVKVLPPHPGLDASFVERFQLEAKTIARLQHPHILPLYDYGQVDDIFYLVMAYIDGGTLEDRLASGPMSLREVERVLREMASALDFAHRQNIIHRDIKPANILLSSEGFSLLADFGIAKIAAEGGVDLTGTGVVGTPAYMAPEQAQGLPFDHHVDIYALGVVVFQMLTGRQPFTAQTPMQVMLKVMQEPAPNVLSLTPALPEELGAVIDRALAKDPADRYPSAITFAEAFSAAIHDTDELQHVREQMPLQEGAAEAHTVAPGPSVQRTTPSIGGDDNAPTMVPAQQPTEVPVQPSQPVSDTGQQTIVVQSGINAPVLLGGMAIIAAALVIAVLLIVGGGDDDGPSSPPPAELTATSASVQAASTALAVAALATETAAAATETPIPASATPEPPTATPTEILPTATPSPTPVPSFGRVAFSTRNNPGDSVSISVDGLAPHGPDQVYVAWLVNTESGEALNLGELVIDGFGAGVLPFTDADGRLLPASFNAVLLTLEADPAAAQPGDAIAYSGQIPLELSDALTNILIASENGLSGGSLLDGARTEARIAEQHAGLASRSGSVSGMHSHAEHTVNILNGSQEDYNGNGRPENPGRGVGVYAFLDLMEGALMSAVNAPNASPLVATEAELMRVCIQNTRIRADRIVELEFELLAEQEDVLNVEEQATESLRLAEELAAGFDLNENGQVEPFEGECGLDAIETFGPLLATMTLAQGDVTDS